MRRLSKASALALSFTLAASTAFAEVSVKLGVLNDRSGPYADTGGEGSVIAAKLAADDFGAVEKGLKVEIVSADHQNKPDIGLGIARKWYDQENVDVILDVPISSIAFAVSNLTQERNKIFIASSSGSSELTGARCQPNTISYTYDTWALANSTATAVTKRGGKSWYFITVDYAFGHQLEKDSSDAVVRNGGKVLGAVRTPLETVDFSSYLLRAQTSGASVIGLANGTAHTRDATKQSREFGIQEGGQKLAALLIVINEIRALGLDAGQGLLLTESFYWDFNDRTRAFSKRFAARNGGRVPTMFQAGVYAATLHYLKAVAEAGTKDTATVLTKMKSTPTDDDVFGRGYIRKDGRKMHDMHLFEVKKPSESKGEWDLYKHLATIPAEEAFRPLSEAGCKIAQGQ